MKFLKAMFKHELISGASLIFFGSLLASLFHFFFNLVMTRNLSVVDYGIFASLVSLISLAGLPVGAAIPAIVSFGGSYFAEGRLDMVRSLFFKIGKLLFLFAIFVFILLFLFTQQVQKFFNLTDTTLIILANFTIFFGILNVVNQGLLQAKLAFKFIAATNILGAFLKLLLGTIFVLAGFSAGGALWGLLLSLIIPYLLSFLPLRFIFRKTINVPHISVGKLVGYAVPSSIALFSLTSFITTDIILVKHFFSPTDAGIYATLSLIGKVIFFFSAPIATVMFPIIVQKHARKESINTIFTLSFLLVLSASVALTLFYFLFPVFAIGFFSKSQEALTGAPLLGLFGIFITLYALLYVLTNFYLSIKKTSIYIPLVVGAVFQASLIWLYHESFLQILIISLSIESLLLIVLLLYYWKLYGSKTRPKT